MTDGENSYKLRTVSETQIYTASKIDPKKTIKLMIHSMKIIPYDKVLNKRPATW